MKQLLLTIVLAVLVVAATHKKLEKRFVKL